jgi:transposase-like protein
MYPLVESYLQGHHTQKAFCAEHGLSTSVLNYWLAKYRRERAPEATHHRGAFMEITPGPAPAEQVLFEVVYPHGVRLRLFQPVEPAYLERLLALAGR